MVTPMSMDMDMDMDMAWAWACMHVTEASAPDEPAVAPRSVTEAEALG